MLEDYYPKPIVSIIFFASSNLFDQISGFGEAEKRRYSQNIKTHFYLVAMLSWNNFLTADLLAF